jgi:hypothetical protein
MAVLLSVVAKGSIVCHGATKCIQGDGNAAMCVGLRCFERWLPVLHEVVTGVAKEGDCGVSTLLRKATGDM